MLVALVLVALGVAFDRWRIHRPASIADSITVYYSKTDGETLAPWKVSLGPARDPKSVAFYATAQALAGPPPGTDAIRFPAGTIVRHADVIDQTATIDLGGAVSAPQEGSFAESGEFKALVWTLTALPGVKAVRITVGGERVATLPGGHFELDRPLSRTNW